MLVRVLAYFFNDLLCFAIDLEISIYTFAFPVCTYNTLFFIEGILKEYVD